MSSRPALPHTPDLGRVAPILLIFIGLATLPATAQLNHPDDFTIIVLPDTQNAAEFHPHVLLAQTQWIVNNRTKYNIRMVLGLGDIVNDGASATQQKNADAAIKLLDQAKIPYMLAIGNHDYDGANAGAKTRTATGFNRWWGSARYANYAYYKGNLPGGSYPQGSNENFYGVLTIGTRSYLFLILEYVPRTAALQWAANVITQNLDKYVIVVSHSHTYWDKTRVDRCDTADLLADNDGDETWAVLRRFAHVHLILSGHITAGRAARRVDLGNAGNLVNFVFSSYQDEVPYGGNGWLRIMTFHPSQKTITVQTYSPLPEFPATYWSAQLDKHNFRIYMSNPGLIPGTTGNLSGFVRADRGSIYGNPCRRIAAATVRNSTGATALTQTNGSYSFDLLPAGTYSLIASAPGWYPSAAQSERIWGAYRNPLNLPTNTTELNFYLKPILGFVGGKVLSASGKPISGAKVTFVGGTIATNIARLASGTGTYSSGGISVGNYQVTASAVGLISETKTVTVYQNATATVNFTLR